MALDDTSEKDERKLGTVESPDSGSEKEEVRHWLKAISKAEKWRDDQPMFKDARRFNDEYKGRWDWLAAGIKIPLVPINLVFAYVKTEIARLSFHDPWITVNAKRQEDLGAARIAEQVLNYTWRELNMKRQVKLALLDGLLTGHGWIKTGYTAEVGTVESRPSEKRGPGRPKKEEEAVVDTNQNIKSETVFGYHIPYKNVVFDPTATWPAMDSARWVAIKWEKPLRAVKKSGIYKNTEMLRPVGEEAEKNPGAGEKYRDANLCRGWEIYDLDHMKILTVSQGCEYYLREIDYPEWLNAGYPLTEFSFNPIPDSVYALSDIAPHEPQIVELTKMMAIMMNHLKRWNRQIFTKPGFMTDENKDNFKNANDGAIIEIQGDPNNDFFIPPYAPVQQDIYGIWNLAMDMWKNICGQGAMDRGAEGKAATRTLGELRMQLQGGRARSDEKLDMLEDSIADVARKMMSVMQKMYDIPKLARIVGTRNIMKVLQARPTAQQGNAMQPQSSTSEFGISWNKEDIHGDMDVDVIAGSTAPMDAESQLDMMERAGPQLLQALASPPGSPAAKEYVREFVRLMRIPSLESVVDLSDQSPPQMPPKLMEIQAKVKARQQEMQAKTQAKGQENQMKMVGLKAKTESDVIKSKLEIEKAQMQMHLEKHKLQQQMKQSVLQTLLSSVKPHQSPNGSPQQ